MIDADYRFGWRWLLPIVHGDQVLLLGFTEQEQAFWRHTLADAVVTEDAANATVWLVNNLPHHCTASLDPAQLRSLCVVGSGKVVATWRRWMTGRFVEVNDYALLPSHNPRVVVPLKKSAWAMHGLALHRPGRLIARLAIVFLKALARMGVVWPLRAHMICIANKDISISPQGAPQAGLKLSSIGAPQSFALYLGTPDDNRKTVILPLGGTWQGILKQGESPIARAALHNEAAALQAISKSPLAAQVPVLVDMLEMVDRTTLLQEYRPRQRIATNGMNRAAVDFLVALSRQERSVRPLIKVLEQTDQMTANEERWAEQMTCARMLRNRLDALAAVGTMVWGHRSHGDFAPWNCAWTSKGFFVFDWEASQLWDLALGDALYYVLSPFVHVQKKPDAREALAMALEFVTDVATRSGLTVGSPPPSVDHYAQSEAIKSIPLDYHGAANLAIKVPQCETEVRVYLALWLLGHLSFSPFYGEMAVRLDQSWS